MLVLLALLSGLLAGGLHVLSGPDHLAAVLPLSVRLPERAHAIGAVWGLGHGGSMLLWLLAALCFRQLLPLEFVSELAELLVGFALLWVGLLGVRRELRRRCARVPHEPCEDIEKQNSVTEAFGFGVLHGSAGAGHLAATLPMLGLSAQGSVLYCAGFTLSGVASMAFFGACTRRLVRNPSIASQARPFCALSALLVGGFWIVTALSSPASP